MSNSFLFPSCPAGGSIDSDCAFEPDYAVPPLSMTEGMQHIRIMEGVTRSLPSSPLLSHQAIGVRLQPVKKLTGRGRCGDTRFLGSARGFADSVGKESTAVWAECGSVLCRHFPSLAAVLSWRQHNSSVWEWS